MITAIRESQGSSSVAEYAVDYHILAAERRWDDTALQGVFVRGLAESVKDELAVRDETNSLESLIFLAIRLDNRLRESRQLTLSGHTSPQYFSAQPVVSTVQTLLLHLPASPYLYL